MGSQPRTCRLSLPANDRIGAAPPRTIPREAAEFGTDIGDVGDLEQFINACSNCPETGPAVRLIDDLDRPILQPLIDAVEAEGGAKKVTIISPYFGNGQGVIELATWLGVDAVSVFAPAQTRELFPAQAAASAGLIVHYVTSPLLVDPSRSLHGKGIEIETNSGSRVLLTGSVNATKSALCDGVNVELGVLRVLTDRSFFGWSSTAHVPEFDPLSFDSGARAPVISAAFAEGEVTGQILWGAPVNGLWTGTLHVGLRRFEFLSPVSVDLGGRFRIESKDMGDTILRASALQLELRREGQVARGWVDLPDYLDAVRERGPLAEALVRVITDTHDINDLEVILEFAAREPAAFARRVAVAAPGKLEESETSDRLIDPKALAPRSAPVGLVPAIPGIRSAFDRLVDALCAKMETGRRNAVGFAPDAEEPDDEGGNSAGATAAGVHRKYFDRLFDVFKRRIRSTQSAEDRRRDLATLLNFMHYCADRLEDWDEDGPGYQRHWLELAAECSQGADGVNAVDVGYALGACRDVLMNQRTAAEVHGRLQKRWLGPLSDNISTALGRAIADGKGSDWLPSASISRWRGALEATLAATTQCQHANALLESVRAGTLTLSPQGFENHAAVPGLHAQVLRKRRDRLIPMQQLGRARLHCPGCSIKLTTSAEEDLRHTRLSKCSDLMCGRYLIYVGP